MDVERKAFQIPPKKRACEGSLPEVRIPCQKTKNVAAKLRSIEHFMFLYGNEAGYFLPPRELITWSYIRQVLTGVKILLKFERLGTNFQFPKSRGFRVKTAFEEMSSDKDFMRYFPDIPPKTNIPREYFLTVSIKRYFGFYVRRNFSAF